LFLVLLSQPLFADSPQKEDLEVSSFSMIGENSIVAQSSPENPPRTQVLGSVGDDYDPEVVNLLEKIIGCESSGNYQAENPTSYAWGLCQFIPSTKDYVEKKWGIKIDWNNPDDQYYACYRLLDEEGTRHWKATQWCWSK